MNTKAMYRKVYEKLFKYASESYFLKNKGLDVSLSEETLRYVLSIIVIRWNVTLALPDELPKYSIKEYFDDVNEALDMNMRAYPDEVYEVAIKQQLENKPDVITESLFFNPSIDEAKKITNYVNNTFGDVLSPFMYAMLKESMEKED